VGRYIFATLLLLGCGDDLPMQIAGEWSYRWQVRDDQHLHGTLVLEQAGPELTGEIGYPVDYPHPEYEPAWTWLLEGRVSDKVHLHAPAPNTAWDDPWTFVLSGSPSYLHGDAIPETPSGPRPSGWTMTLRR
jgi:hypothetical protein